MIEENTDNNNQGDNSDGQIVTWSQQTPWIKVLTVFLMLAILICVGAAVYIISTGHSSDPFTEFYILGKDGKADNYPTILKAGEKAEIKPGIINHEYAQTQYTVTVSTNGTDLQKIGPITLDNGQKWEELVTFSIVKAGAKQKIDFLLYRQSDTVPYLKLNIIVDVN